MLRYLLIAGCVCAFVASIGLTGLWGISSALRRPPEFYQTALEAEPLKQEQAGDQLERSVLDLRNDVQRVGHWEAVFTDDQINGWLAADMPEKFPNLLPASVRDPRVAISPDQVQIACRYDANLTSIVHLSLDASLTDEPNVIAVRIRGARAGLFPLPLKSVLDDVTRRAHASQIVLRWSQIDGDPVALVTIPSQHDEYDGSNLRVLEFRLDEGQFYISGETGRDTDKPL